jgi:hypothetical protein
MAGSSDPTKWFDGRGGTRGATATMPITKGTSRGRPEAARRGFGGLRRVLAGRATSGREAIRIGPFVFIVDPSQRASFLRTIAS